MSSKDGPKRLMKRRFDTRCTPSRFHSEECTTFIALKPRSASAEVTGNCFHGALQFNENELLRNTRSTVVDEISEAILRRFEVDAKSLTISSGAAETRRAMRLTPEPDTAAAIF